ncbi:hypothetical protein ACFQ2M_04320 [Kitasatospora saccharophila]|uniref:hypothetical protein n=1 Tax=Kitasatospora saccharophila TaxID=407973 RepID=UPI00364186C6
MAAVAAVGAIVFVSSLRDATVAVKLYDSIEVGQSEESVNERLPVGSDFLTGDFHRIGPPVPEGAHCRWFASDRGSGTDGQDVLRFCFKDGRLVEKQHFRGKV